MAKTLDEALAWLTDVAAGIDDGATEELAAPILSELERLKRACAGFEKDATRYRWLRQREKDREHRGHVCIARPHFESFMNLSLEFADEVIDDEMAEATAEKK